MEVVVVNIEGQIVEGATVKYVDKLGVRHDKPSEADRCDAIADSPIEIIPSEFIQECKKVIPAENLSLYDGEVDEIVESIGKLLFEKMTAPTKVPSDPV